MMRSKVTVLIFVLVSGALTAFGQCSQWVWPEGELKAVAEEKYVLHNDLVKNEQYKQAIEPHKWLLENTPNLQRAIYINGEKIYTSLADEASDAKDTDQMNAYVDSLLTIYDMRLQYCPSNSIYDRRALYTFKYWYKDETKLEKILEFYDVNYEKNGAKMNDSNVKYHMTAVQLNKLKLDNLTDEQILEYYDNLSGILVQKKAAKPGSVKKYDQIQADLDEILLSLIDFDCEKTRNILGPKFREDPTDIGTANQIFKFMLKDKCTDDPLWLDAAKAIFEETKDFGIAKTLGLKYKASGDIEHAEYYFKEGVKVASDATDKADMMVQLGHIEREAGNKVAARQHYRDALEANSADKEPFTFIGILYMSSYDDCAKKVSQVEDRAVFIAAYNMFQRAGNSKQMAAAKEQFPSRGELFDYNLNAGDTWEVKCWINETVKLATRD